VSDLRKALTKRTGWSKQVLSKRVKKLRTITPMATATAHGVLAHQQGMKIDKYLDADELRLVQNVLPAISQAASSLSASTNGGPDGRVRSKASVVKGRLAGRTIVFPSNFSTDDPLLSDSKLREAREMAEVYPVLYVLENSIRELVKRVLSSTYGTNWWDSALTSAKARDVKSKADQRRTGEDHMRWHQRRGVHPIDYVDLKDLGTIILSKQTDFFPGVLGDSRDWFEQFMRELEPSRNVLCHMNPLTGHNIADVRLKAERWRSLVDGRQEFIPKATS
jgi:hypothetical protein